MGIPFYNLYKTHHLHTQRLPHPSAFKYTQPHMSILYQSQNSKNILGYVKKALLYSL